MNSTDEAHHVWYTVEDDANYSFDLRRGVLANSPLVEQTVGVFLLNGLANLGQLKSILRRMGLTAAVNHFDAHVATRQNVRIGDFGEVVAGHLLEDAEGVTQLIEKLRHRESPNWPMKLTDVFCVRFQDERIVSFVFGEAKAGTTKPSVALGQEAYRQVYQDFEDEEPQILFFTLDRLAESNKTDAYMQLEEAMHQATPVPRALRLVFVFEEDVWRDEILRALHDDFASGDLPLANDFRCYVLTRDGLKDVICGAYAEAKQVVTNGN